MSEYFHGIRIVEKSTLNPSVSTKSSSVIAILGTVSETPKDFEIGKPYLVNSIAASKSYYVKPAFLNVR